MGVGSLVAAELGKAVELFEWCVIAFLLCIIMVSISWEECKVVYIYCKIWKEERFQAFHPDHISSFTTPFRLVATISSAYCRYLSWWIIPKLTSEARSDTSPSSDLARVSLARESHIKDIAFAIGRPVQM